jgi:death-on-curing family protein
LEPEIEAEYHRTLAQIADPDERQAPDCLTANDVLKAHFLIANYFLLEGSGLGGVGPRDIGLLLSAISRQTVEFGGKRKWMDTYSRCATLLFGLIKNHPFHDANKRTAFLSALFQLDRVGRCPSVSQQEFEDLMVDVADSALTKYARYNALVREGDPDPEVKFMAWYLRQKTRNIDKRYYAVTYRELQAILLGYGFSLEDPSGNHINIIHLADGKSWGQIGFPRWGAHVGKGAIRTVREATRLTYNNGIDSEAFFRGVDPMRKLISIYHEPLMRLAER